MQGLVNGVIAAVVAGAVGLLVKWLGDRKKEDREDDDHGIKVATFYKGESSDLRKRVEELEAQIAALKSENKEQANEITRLKSRIYDLENEQRKQGENR